MIPFNRFLWIYLAFAVLASLVDLAVEVVNIRHLKKYGQEPPEGLDAFIDGKRLHNIERYTIDKTRLSIVETIAGKLILLFVILYGLLPRLVEVLKDIHFVPGGLIFFGAIGLLLTLIAIPFNYYSIFIIEERYGFNTRSFTTWIGDLLKSFALSLILGGVLLTSLLLIVRLSHTMWWIFAWLLFFSFQLLMTVLYPTVIAPLFNKFTPIGSGPLEEKIRGLSIRGGLKIQGIYQMDEGKRSRHTNAYFTGIGKVKRIVLYDTLLQAHDDEEVLAVLAHEIGHLKGNHIKKQIFITGAASLVLLYLASRLLTWDTMYQSFGFLSQNAYVGLFLVSLLWEPVGFFLSPLAMAISRRFETYADRHVFRLLKNTEPMIRGLKKMARDNLSNLRPHPLYTWFHYSHPPILQRIKSLEGMVATQVMPLSKK